MTTPIERAAEAVSGALAPLLGQSPTGPDETDYGVARAVFESIDRDALSELLWLTDYGPEGRHGADVLADAIHAYLLSDEGGAE